MLQEGQGLGKGSPRDLQIAWGAERSWRRSVRPAWKADSSRWVPSSGSRGRHTGQVTFTGMAAAPFLVGTVVHVPRRGLAAFPVPPHPRLFGASTPGFVRFHTSQRPRIREPRSYCPLGIAETLDRHLTHRYSWRNTRISSSARRCSSLAIYPMLAACLKAMASRVTYEIRCAPGAAPQGTIRSRPRLPTSQATTGVHSASPRAITRLGTSPEYVLSRPLASRLASLTVTAQPGVPG